MKTCKHSMTTAIRVVTAGAALGAAILTASALEAQSGGQSSTPPRAAPTETAASISTRAKDFLRRAAQANQMEIALADVAEEKSQNSAVRELEQMLRTDHQLNYVQLQSIARAHLFTLDATLSWMNQRTISRLQKSSDMDFDKEYAEAMLQDHVACIKTFDKGVANIEEPDVKQYAQQTLPTLRGHLLRWKKAARGVGVNEATISAILKGLPTDEVERALTFNQN